MYLQHADRQDDPNERCRSCPQWNLFPSTQPPQFSSSILPTHTPKLQICTFGPLHCSRPQMSVTRVFPEIGRMLSTTLWKLSCKHPDFWLAETKGTHRTSLPELRLPPPCLEGTPWESSHFRLLGTWRSKKAKHLWKPKWPQGQACVEAACGYWQVCSASFTDLSQGAW